MKARAKLVLPAPSSPFNAIKSPGTASPANRAANAVVAFSAGRSMTGTLALYPQRRVGDKRRYGLLFGDGFRSPAHRRGAYPRRPGRDFRRLRVRHAGDALSCV